MYRIYVLAMHTYKKKLPTNAISIEIAYVLICKYNAISSKLFSAQSYLNTFCWTLWYDAAEHFFCFPILFVFHCL